MPFGWGTISWGTGTWGGGPYASLFILDCFVLNERMLRVILSKAPQTISPIRAHDALNPTVWGITNDRTERALKVLGAAMVGEKTVDLYTLEKFGSHFVTHTVSAPTLFDAGGAPIVLPYSDEFLGVEARKLSLTKQGQVDIANPQFQAETGEGGTWQIGSSGDYSKESGIAYLRKLCIRRLVTNVGEFFHIDDYGIGLQTKMPLVTSDMVRLRGEIERQLLKEPEFGAVAAKLTLTPDGVLSIALRIRLLPSQEEVFVPIKAAVRIQ